LQCDDDDDVPKRWKLWFSNTFSEVKHETHCQESHISLVAKGAHTRNMARRYQTGPVKKQSQTEKRQAPHATLLFFDGGKNRQGGSLHKPCLEEHCNLKKEHWEAAAGEGKNK
jgi:hypothetical protein